MAWLNTEHSHDWGAQVCYEAARERPDIVDAVVGTGIPVSTNALTLNISVEDIPVSSVRWTICPHRLPCAYFA